MPESDTWVTFIAVPCATGATAAVDRRVSFLFTRCPTAPTRCVGCRQHHVCSARWRRRPVLRLLAMNQRHGIVPGDRSSAFTSSDAIAHHLAYVRRRSRNLSTASNSTASPVSSGARRRVGKCRVPSAWTRRGARDELVDSAAAMPTSSPSPNMPTCFTAAIGATITRRGPATAHGELHRRDSAQGQYRLAGAAPRALLDLPCS